MTIEVAEEHDAFEESMQPDQSAIVFDANGAVHLYFPKYGDDAVNQGTQLAMLCALITSDTDAGAQLRDIARHMVESMIEREPN